MECSRSQMEVLVAGARELAAEEWRGGREATHRAGREAKIKSYTLFSVLQKKKQKLREVK